MDEDVHAQLFSMSQVTQPQGVVLLWNHTNVLGTSGQARQSQSILKTPTVLVGFILLNVSVFLKVVSSEPQIAGDVTAAGPTAKNWPGLASGYSPHKPGRVCWAQNSWSFSQRSSSHQEEFQKIKAVRCHNNQTKPPNNFHTPCPRTNLTV